MRNLFLTLHVLGAIVALGFSLGYGLWTARGDATGPAERAFALRTVSWIDRRMTTPAYILQLITGLVLVGLIDWDQLRQAWLAVSIAIYALLTVLAMTIYAPAHRRQTAAAERIAAGDAGARDEYDAAARLAMRWGVVVTVLTITIVVLMVTKPA